MTRRTLVSVARLKFEVVDSVTLVYTFLAPEGWLLQL